MKVRLNQDDPDWPGRIGEALLMEPDRRDVERNPKPPFYWVQFDDGEGGQYLPDEFEVIAQTEGSAS